MFNQLLLITCVYVFYVVYYYLSETDTQKTIASAVENPPSNLTITSPATLTWLPPAGDLNCSFNYIVNITNRYRVTEQVYNNSTSLVLTDNTCGENYSFVVAVQDDMDHGVRS